MENLTAQPHYPNPIVTPFLLTLLPQILLVCPSTAHIPTVHTVLLLHMPYPALPSLCLVLCWCERREEEERGRDRHVPARMPACLVDHAFLYLLITCLYYLTPPSP